MPHPSQWKLLFVLKDSALNRGMNTGIENLAWRLARRGSSVHILAGGTKPERHQYDIPANVTYHFTGGPGKPFDHMALYTQLQQTYHFDAVIGWLINIAPLSILERRNLSRPKFIAHEGQLNKKPTLAQRIRFFTAPAIKRLKRPSFKSFFWKNVIKTIDAAVSVNHVVNRNLHKIYYISESICTVIPRGVDTSFFSPDQSLDRTTLSNPPRLIFTGNISLQKGLGDVVDALAYVNRPVEFVLCGNDKGYLDTLNRRLAEIDSGHTFIFNGPLYPNELLAQLNSADIFIFCSWGEGIGKSLLEAMACALPVIVSDIGAFEYVVTNEVNGLVARGRDPKSIAKAINRFLGEPDLRRNCEMNARNTIETSFGEDVEVEAWCTLLGQQISSRRSLKS